MDAVFLKLLNLSISASWLILAVILVRLLLKKAPKWISCILWALAALRLICPFSLESALSLIPSSETIPGEIIFHEGTQQHAPVWIDVIDDPAFSQNVSVPTGQPAGVIQTWVILGTLIWLAGMVILLLHAFISYIRLKKSVGASVPVRDNIFASDDVKSPFILGIIRPVIYVPSFMAEVTLDHVIRHETAHIKRRDHWWKPLGFLLMTVYWFNPLCWIAYVLLCRDIELACDERVIRDMDKDSVAEYSQALLDCSFPRRRIAVCPLAFGEVGVKERVRSVLNYKKPAFWVIAIALVVCVAVGVCFGTDPVDTADEDSRKWDCSVICKEASTPDHYVINYSDVKVSSQTGTLTFQNRNAFDIVVHVLSEGDTEIISKLIPAGGCYSYLKMNDKPCTVGVHADTDVNTEIKLFVYDGNWSETYVAAENLTANGTVENSTPEITAPADDPAEDPLDAAVSSAILEHYASDEPDGLIHVESHVILGNEVMSGTPKYGSNDHAEKITAYVLVHHVKYSTYGGVLDAVGGSCGPAAITFKISASGEYVPEEYWEPRDGSYYVKDIRDKFPGAAADDALNDQAYIEDLKKQNYSKALSYLNSSISSDARVDELLKEIMSSPVSSSGPGDYIREHGAEYEALLSYGKFTLRFCFTEFLKGGQTDLRGHIMASACRDIAEKLGEELGVDTAQLTGQEWFDEFRDSAQSLAEQYSREDLEKRYPASFLLLQMSDEDFMTK